jgi:SAM-dependent methyltransferase
VVTSPAPNYGLDAPGVVRNLLLAGLAGLLLWGSVAAGLWSGFLTIHPGSVEVRIGLADIGLGVGLSCTAMGLWMIWTSRIGKVLARERLLDHVTWTGREQVLDVGCGRGLMLIGAARRLTTGRATGVDIWQSEDLSGNGPDAAMANARSERVAEKIAIETADMRRLPFPDSSFDVVVSCAAIHNVPTPPDRARAIVEIARVLKPGGTALIDDIRYLGDYGAAFQAHGCRDIQRLYSPIVSALWTLISFGSLRPGVILVRKDA